MSTKIYRSFFKRFLDLIISTVGIIIFLPLCMALTIVIAIAFKSSPFFLQVRPGKEEKLFKIIKFKTMNNKKDKDGNLLSNKARTTKLGRFVRKYSLDEIPQLLNVFKGDMSLIGPRPLVVEYLPYYSLDERKRHEVKPGITGLAQVKGRNFLIWEERFALDLKYIKDLSFSQDMKILFWTALKLLSKSEVAVDQDEFLDIFNVYRQKQWDAIEELKKVKG